MKICTEAPSSIGQLLQQAELKTEGLKRMRGVDINPNHHKLRTKHKPRRWYPWMSTPENDLDSFPSARNRLQPYSLKAHTFEASMKNIIS